MKHIPLPQEVAARTGFTDLVVVTPDTDLTETAANTAQTLALLNVLAGDAVLAAAIVVKTALSDASDAAFNSNTLIVGDDGDTDRFITSFETNVNGTEILYKVHPSTTPYVFLADNTIDAIFAAMAAKSLVDIDGGEVHFYFRIARLARLSAQV